MHHLAMLKHLSNIPGPGSAGGLMPKFNLFFLVHRYMSGQNFHKDAISSFTWSC